MEVAFYMMKRLRRVLACAAVAVMGAGVAGAGVAEAGVYTTASTCAHATAGNRICYDVSAGTIVVLNNGGGVVAGPTPATPYFGAPSRGWIAYDFECNATPIQVSVGGPPVTIGWQTTFSTGGGFGLPAQVKISSAAGYGENVLVNQSASDLIAWYANSNSGLECFIVP